MSIIQFQCMCSYTQRINAAEYNIICGIHKYTSNSCKNKTIWVKYDPSIELLDELLKYNRIENLFMSYNNIKYCNIDIFKLTTIKMLDLSHNNISYLPDEISQLTNLINLNISYNSFDYFPQSIININTIEVLIMSNNNISIMPNNIDKLSNLKTFEIENNSLYTILKNMTNLKKLKHFRILVNRLGDFYKFIFGVDAYKISSNYWSPSNIHHYINRNSEKYDEIFTLMLLRNKNCVHQIPAILFDEIIKYMGGSDKIYIYIKR